VEDPAWTAGLLRWLRGDGQLRTAAVVGAAEYVRTRLEADGSGPADDHPDAAAIRNRAVIASVLRRADEPGELLGYWTSRYGRALPKPVQRPRPPIIVGGGAGPRSAALCARWGDEYNTTSATADECRERRTRVERAWERAWLRVRSSRGAERTFGSSGRIELMAAPRRSSGPATRRGASQREPTPL
jgi:hypothetical protein